MEQGFEVTAGKLNQQREQLESLNGKFKSNIDKLEDYAQKAVNSWEGEASNAFKNKFTTEKEKMLSLYNTVTEYVQAINTIISNYSDAERQNTDLLK